MLLDRFLEGAVEYDVDAFCDGDEVWIVIMEHKRRVCTPVIRRLSSLPSFSQRSTVPRLWTL